MHNQAAIKSIPPAGGTPLGSSKIPAARKYRLPLNASVPSAISIQPKVMPLDGVKAASAAMASIDAA